jgi:hypothetical protein
MRALCKRGVGKARLRKFWIPPLQRVQRRDKLRAMHRSMNKRVTNHKTATGGPPEVIAR